MKYRSGKHGGVSEALNPKHPILQQLAAHAQKFSSVAPRPSVWTASPKCKASASSLKLHHWCFFRSKHNKTAAGSLTSKTYLYLHLVSFIWQPWHYYCKMSACLNVECFFFTWRLSTICVAASCGWHVQELLCHCNFFVVCIFVFKPWLWKWRSNKGFL